MPKFFDKFQKLKYNDAKTWECYKLDYRHQIDLNKFPELALPNFAAVSDDKRKFRGFV